MCKQRHYDNLFIAHGMFGVHKAEAPFRAVEFHICEDKVKLLCGRSVWRQHVSPFYLIPFQSLLANKRPGGFLCTATEYPVSPSPLLHNSKFPLRAGSFNNKPDESGRECMIGQWAHGGWLMDCTFSQASLLAGTQEQALHSCHCTLSLCHYAKKYQKRYLLCCC